MFPAGCPPPGTAWLAALSVHPLPCGLQNWPFLSGWSQCVRWLLSLSCNSLFCEMKLLAFCGSKLVVTVATY